MEEIRKVISGIEAKVAQMRASLEGINEENRSFSHEILKLKEKLQQRESELSDFRKKYELLLHQNSKEEIREVEGDKNKEIDALVREIEDCINQLKE